MEKKITHEWILLSRVKGFQVTALLGSPEVIGICIYKSVESSGLRVEGSSEKAPVTARTLNTQPATTASLNPKP